MATKAQALAELEQAHAEFRAKIADLPAPAWDEVWLGDWSLAELLAHMAGWWHEMTPAFARVARGERPVPEGVDYSDPDPFNARFAATPERGRAALVAWDTAFSGYLGAARALGDEFYGQGEQGRPKIGNRLLQGAGIGHFEEHGPELDQWLATR